MINRKFYVNVGFLLLSIILINVKASPRIIGGIEVTDRTFFAYQVSIRYNDEHICGGSIINGNYILTASHCVFYSDGTLLDVNDLTIVSGDLDLYQSDENTVTTGVVKIYSHPNYNSATVENDIALMQLKTPLVFTDTTKQIVLAESQTADDVPCVVSGWGFTEEGGIKSGKLRFVSIPIVNTKECNNAYGGKIKSGMLCAGFMDGGKDACQFDSGGPLACENKLTGIVSWGIGCGRAKNPGVYTNISKYTDFIQSIINGGQKSLKVEPKIVGGKDVTDITKYPHQVSIRYNGRHICGGSIIDNIHVLSAAHCFLHEGVILKASRIDIVSGTVDRTDTSNLNKALYIFTHDDYYKGRNDIALIRVKGRFATDTPNIKPIPLQTNPIPDEKTCVISGWGVEQFGSKELTQSLKYAAIKIVSRTKCESSYKGKIKDGMLCAAELHGESDACQGDSGGPLVCDDKLTGIVSWGTDCAVEGFPGVYTDVLRYTQWIKSQKARSFSSNIYLNKCLFIFGIIFSIFIYFK